jgi:AraC family transcriptional regulator, transcriptional activator of pobA
MPTRTHIAPPTAVKRPTTVGAVAGARRIPRFALYGTEPEADWIDLVHFERIPDRASLFDWEIGPHLHDALIQVLHPRSGGGVVVIDGTVHTLPTPGIVVVPARCVHGFRFAPGTDGAVITAAQRPLEALAQAAAPGLLATIRRPALIGVDPHGRHAAALPGLIDAIARESATHAAGQATAGTALLLALFVQIDRLEDRPGDTLDVRGTPPATPARPPADARVQRFLGLLDAGYRERRTVAHYAQAVGITPGQLTRVCRQALGHSALEAINARVLHEARRELAYSSLGVKKIAAELGFSDDAYFSRFFKKHSGQPPTAFRDHARRTLATAHADAGHGAPSSASVSPRHRRLAPDNRGS